MTARRAVVKALGSGLLAIACGSRAQTAGRVHRIGILAPFIAPAPLFKVFVGALRDLGWTEGVDMAFEFRSSEGRNERYAELAGELAASKVNVIVSVGGVTSTLAAKAATATIPIVFVNANDPVKFGLVASLARPDANVTGIAIPAVDWGKWLQLAHEAVPSATRVAVIANPSNRSYDDYAAQNQAAAQRLGLQLQLLPVARAEDIAEAFAAMRRLRAQVLVFGPDGLFFSNVRQIMALAAASRLPVIGPDRFFAEAGAILTYGFDASYSFRRAAAYVDKILKGVRPADLPVDQPAHFEMFVNVASATTLGLALPQSLLLQADEVLR